MTFFFNQVHPELSTHVSKPEEATLASYRSSLIKRTPVKGYSLIGLLSQSESIGESNAGALNKHIPFLA